MLDIHMLEENPLQKEIQPMRGLSPQHGVFTAEQYLPHARRIFPDKIHVGSGRIERIGHSRMPSTAMASLWFATQVLGANCLLLHGFDLGGRNFMGETETVERGERRWPDERKILASVITALRERGTVIHLFGAFKV